MTNKILIIGSSGPISLGLAARFAGQSVVIGRGRTAVQHFDLEDSRTFTALEQADVSHAVFVSAFTGFMPCENDPARAFRTNVKQTAEAVAILNENGVPVSYLSSSAVFGPSDTHKCEHSSPRPNNVYGKTKRLAELQILHGRKTINSIVRLTKLFDKNLPIFRRWTDSAQQHNTLTASGSYRLSPLPLSMVVDHVQKIVEQKITGITHLTSDQDLSYFDLARALFPRARVELEDQDNSEIAAPPGSATLAADRAESAIFGLDACVREIRNELNIEGGTTQ